jgi:hypothetical protein
MPVMWQYHRDIKHIQGGAHIHSRDAFQGTLGECCTDGSCQEYMKV